MFNKCRRWLDSLLSGLTLRRKKNCSHRRFHNTGETGISKSRLFPIRILQPWRTCRRSFPECHTLFSECAWLTAAQNSAVCAQPLARLNKDMQSDWGTSRAGRTPSMSSSSSQGFSAQLVPDDQPSSAALRCTQEVDAVGGFYLKQIIFARTFSWS